MFNLGVSRILDFFLQKIRENLQNTLLKLVCYCRITDVYMLENDAQTSG
jgi:hypothetical protein